LREMIEAPWHRESRHYHPWGFIPRGSCDRRFCMGTRPWRRGSFPTPHPPLSRCARWVRRGSTRHCFEEAARQAGPTAIQTTLYDLIDAIGEAAQADERALIPDIGMHLLRARSPAVSPSPNVGCYCVVAERVRWRGGRYPMKPGNATGPCRVSHGWCARADPPMNPSSRRHCPSRARGCKVVRPHDGRSAPDTAARRGTATPGGLKRWWSAGGRGCPPAGVGVQG
jgi:hypothetical protein